MATNGNQCEATRRDGQRCQAAPLPGRLHCWAHDPELAAKRTEARQRGGRNRSNITRLRGLVPPRLLPVFDTLEAALTEVHAGDITPQQATAMASLARAMTAVLTAGEIEERLRALEQAATDDDGRTRQWR